MILNKKFGTFIFFLIALIAFSTFGLSIYLALTVSNTTSGIILGFILGMMSMISTFEVARSKIVFK